MGYVVMSPRLGSPCMHREISHNSIDASRGGGLSLTVLVFRHSPSQKCQQISHEGPVLLKHSVAKVVINVYVDVFVYICKYTNQSLKSPRAVQVSCVMSPRRELGRPI